MGAGGGASSGRGGSVGRSSLTGSPTARTGLPRLKGASKFNVKLAPSLCLRSASPLGPPAEAAARRVRGPGAGTSPNAWSGGPRPTSGSWRTRPLPPPTCADASRPAPRASGPSVRSARAATARPGPLPDPSPAGGAYPAKGGSGRLRGENCSCSGRIRPDHPQPVPRRRALPMVTRLVCG